MRRLVLAGLLFASVPVDAACRRVEVEAWGRPGHGAALDLHSAPHRLVRSLDTLLTARADPWFGSVAIEGLEAGSVLNAKPASARARLRIELTPQATRDVEGFVRHLTELLQPDAAPRLLAAPCPASEAPSDGG